MTRPRKAVTREICRSIDDGDSGRGGGARQGGGEQGPHKGVEGKVKEEEDLSDSGNRSISVHVGCREPCRLGKLYGNVIRHVQHE